MASIAVNGVRVFEATVEVDFASGAFVARGEIGRDAETLARFARGDACTIDGRSCRAHGTIDVPSGAVTIRGEAFPFRADEWRGHRRRSPRAVKA